VTFLENYNLFIIYIIQMKNNIIITIAIITGVWVSAWALMNNKNVSQENTTTVVQEEGQQEEVRIITVDAKRFEYTPSTLRIQQWEKIAIKINDLDTAHSAYFPTLKNKQDAQGNFIIDTSQPGTYEFKCANMCGWWHMDMKGTVIIEPSNTVSWVEIVKMAHNGSQLIPNEVRLKKWKDYTFEITPEVNGQGCMSTIKREWTTTSDAQLIVANQSISFDLKNAEPGTYKFVCNGMGMQQGKVIIEA